MSVVRLVRRVISAWISTVISSIFTGVKRRNPICGRLASLRWELGGFEAKFSCKKSGFEVRVGGKGGRQRSRVYENNGRKRENNPKPSTRPLTPLTLPLCNRTPISLPALLSHHATTLALLIPSPCPSSPLYPFLPPSLSLVFFNAPLSGLTTWATKGRCWDD